MDAEIDHHAGRERDLGLSAKSLSAAGTLSTRLLALGEV